STARYTLSLHDALPIYQVVAPGQVAAGDHQLLAVGFVAPADLQRAAAAHVAAGELAHPQPPAKRALQAEAAEHHVVAHLQAQVRSEEHTSELQSRENLV